MRNVTERFLPRKRVIDWDKGFFLHNTIVLEARPERDLQKDLSETDHTADSDTLLSNKHSSSNPAGHDNLATIVEWRSNQLKYVLHWLIPRKTFEKGLKHEPHFRNEGFKRSLLVIFINVQKGIKIWIWTGLKNNFKRFDEQIIASNTKFKFCWWGSLTEVI